MDKKEVDIYINVISAGANNNTIKEIDKLKTDKIILFGAGENGKSVLKKVKEAKIYYFVDNDIKKIGSSIDGIEIVSYNTLLRIYKDYIIVVTPNNRKEIEEKLIKDRINYVSLEWFLHVNNCN